MCPKNDPTIPCLRRGEPSPLLSTTPGALDPVLCSPVQDRHRHTGVSPEKGHLGDYRTGASIIQIGAERARIVYHQAEKA